MVPLDTFMLEGVEPLVKTLRDLLLSRRLGGARLAQLAAHVRHDSDTAVAPAAASQNRTTNRCPTAARASDSRQERDSDLRRRVKDEWTDEITTAAQRLVVHAVRPQLRSL